MSVGSVNHFLRAVEPANTGRSPVTKTGGRMDNLIFPTTAGAIFLRPRTLTRSDAKKNAVELPYRVDVLVLCPARNR